MLAINMMRNGRPRPSFLFVQLLLYLVVCNVNAFRAEVTSPTGNTPGGVLDDPRAATIQEKAVALSLLPKKDEEMTLEQLEEIVSIDDIDRVLDEVTGTKGGDVIRPVKPYRYWLWRRWGGTVLSEVLPSVVVNMLVSLGICVAIRKGTGGSWAIGLQPDASSHLWIARLDVFSKVWHYLMTLTTFTLSFYVSESYGVWKDVFGMGRSIQGRLNDISTLLATHATRDRRTGSYTQQANELLDSVAQKSRAFHILHWASCAKQYRLLLTPKGMERMVQRGIISRGQLQALEQMDLAPTQRQIAFLEWMMLSVRDGLLNDKILMGGTTGLQSVLMEKFCDLRAAYGGISSRLAGRIPLAYAHLVQILVDMYLLCAPFALYAELGAFSVISVGLLTFFYHGLLDLAKVFLDPLDNEDYCQQSVRIDLGVLIRESNAGSTKWKKGAELVLPTASETTRRGRS